MFKRPMKRCSASLVTREMQIKAAGGVTSRLLGGCYERGRKRSGREDVGRGATRTAGGITNWCSRWKQHGGSSENEERITRPGKAASGSLPRGNGSDVKEMPAACTGTGTWSSLVSVSRWLGKGARTHAHTHYYSDFTKEILRPRAQAWTTSTLKGISQTRKAKRTTSLLCGP